jgi:hypothetical protein
MSVSCQMRTASVDGTHRKVAKVATQAVRSIKRSLSDRLISRNSRSVRWVSASSTDQSCRHCSGRRQSRAGQNSASRHHTRNNEEPGQYTKGAVRGSPNAASHLSGRKVEGCCSAADGSPAGSRSHASVAPAVMNWRSRRDDRQQRQQRQNGSN